MVRPLCRPRPLPPGMTARPLQGPRAGCRARRRGPRGSAGTADIGPWSPGDGRPGFCGQRPPALGQQPPGPTRGLPCRERCWPRPLSRRPSRSRSPGTAQTPGLQPITALPVPGLGAGASPSAAPRRRRRSARGQQHRIDLHTAGVRGRTDAVLRRYLWRHLRRRFRQRRNQPACGASHGRAVRRCPGQRSGAGHGPSNGRGAVVADTRNSRSVGGTANRRGRRQAVPLSFRPQRSPRAAVPAPPTPGTPPLRHPPLPRTRSPRLEARPPRRRRTSRRRQPLPRRNPRPQRPPSRAPRSSRSWRSRSSRSPEPRRDSTS